MHLPFFLLSLTPFPSLYTHPLTPPPLAASFDPRSRVPPVPDPRFRWPMTIDALFRDAILKWVSTGFGQRTVRRRGPAERGSESDKAADRLSGKGVGAARSSFLPPHLAHCGMPPRLWSSPDSGCQDEGRSRRLP